MAVRLEIMEKQDKDIVTPMKTENTPPLYLHTSLIYIDTVTRWKTFVEN